MSEQRPQRKPIPLNALDVMSTWLYSPPVAGATRRPNFRVRVIGNVPRFSVKTNVPDDKNYGRIDFNCDLPTFAVIASKIRAIAEGKEEGPYQWTYEDHIFIRGERSEKPMVQATLKVGKDKDTGRIYIAVLGYDRPKIQFFFGPSQFHKMQRGDGTELSEADVSAAYAIGFSNGYSEIVYNLLTAEFSEDYRNVAKPPVPGQGNQGGGNRGGGGYQKPKPKEPVENFDDMDW